MHEKQPTMEKFNTDEVLNRLDQAIYDYKERLEKYEQPLSEDAAETQRTAIETLKSISTMDHKPESEEEFIDVIHKEKALGHIDGKAYRLIMSQVY